MPFEYFVRPYQTPDSHGRVIIPSTPGGSRERATLTWGAKVKGTLPTPQVIGFDTKCCMETLQEKDRKAETVKIVASNEPENYITLRRATEIEFQKMHKDACAAFWDQFSGVGGAVDGAFASLSADIHAGGAGVVDEQCHQTMKLQANTASA